MTTQAIILNGGSSAGKSGIARCLQAILPQPWLTFGTDSFVDALPAAMRGPDSGSGSGSGSGIEFGADGSVAVGAGFRTVEAAWIAGMVAMARAGARLVIDEVFLGGAESQRRWRDHLGDVPVLWVGVRCDAAVAAARETARGDRIAGMASAQAELVHRGVVYDVEVDTTHTEAMACAHLIAAHV